MNRKKLTTLGLLWGRVHCAWIQARSKTFSIGPYPRTLRTSGHSSVSQASIGTSFHKYSEIARPLLDLTKKLINFEWGPQQHRAFRELQRRMCSSPVLVQPNFNKRFYLQADASLYGIGAVLSQEGDHLSQSLAKRSKPILHPVAYYSSTFSSAERNYDIYERELLAVMKSLAHWRQYLGWTKEPFVIKTDHANLQYWKSPKNLNR